MDLEGETAPRVFDGPDQPAEPEALRRLVEGVRGVDLAAPPVVLPDFHHKRDMEMPSSITVATRDAVRPIFTSSSVNCGMALLAFDMEVPDRRAIESFYGSVLERYPHPPGRRKELSGGDVLAAATRGAEFAFDHWGLDEEELERIEESGRVDLEPFGGAGDVRSTLPRMIVQLSRLRFGTIGPSNHFLELQVVEEVMDRGAAARLGVRRGQVTLQYHAGGGVLAGQVGRLFGRRKKASRAVRAQMALQRPLHHLGSARSVSQARRRLELYFAGGPPSVSLSEPEGRRLMLANAAAMNYGFAFRVATYANLREMARRAFGPSESRLIVDSPHNSIYVEDVAGERAVVHRHNSCRAYPGWKMRQGTAFGDVGQALLLPGTNRTSSYLCVASGGAERALFSACHGAGTVIEEFERGGRSGPHPEGHRTLRFRYSGDAPTEVPHLDDRGVDSALGVLVGSDIVRPVARMRPIAVLT